MKIHEALVEVMRSVPAVRKEDRNDTQRFNFRGIDTTLNAVGPALRTHGVIVAPQVMEHHSQMVETGKNRTPMKSVTVLVRYTFIGPEGDTLPVEVPGEAFDAGDKGYAKAMSVALRTALLQTLALPTDERDPDADSHEIAGPPKSAADLARDDLLVKVNQLKMNPGDVAQLYLQTFGTSLRDETDDNKIAAFANSLGKAR